MLPPITEGRSRTIPLFSRSGSGFIISPKHSGILCSYPADGGTANKMCGAEDATNGCTPGCVPGRLFDDYGTPVAVNWCGEGDAKKEGAAHVQSAGLCPWRPNQIGDMVRQLISQHPPGTNGNYNEVVVDAAAFGAGLPASVEAFFFLTGNHGRDIDPQQEKKAREAHARFLKTFHVTKDEVPLLQLNISDFEHPFADPGYRF